MTDLEPCGGCGRHIVATEPCCPFCGRLAMRTTSRTFAGGRMSRAAVFAGALAASACGGKAKPAQPQEPPEHHNYQDHPCSDPNPDEIARLEKRRDEAQSDEEKQRIEQELERARMPVCAPYGAPPARRRIV